MMTFYFLRREGKCQIDCGGGDKERGAMRVSKRPSTMQRVTKDLSQCAAGKLAVGSRQRGHRRNAYLIFPTVHSVSKIMMPLLLNSTVISISSSDLPTKGPKHHKRDKSLFFAENPPHNKIRHLPTRQLKGLSPTGFASSPSCYLPTRGDRGSLDTEDDKEPSQVEGARTI